MYVIMGANGHVGSVVAETLLGRGEPVTVITHRDSGDDAWRARGAEVATADVNNVASLRAAFLRGRRAFLLNPPADIATDTDVVERATVANILAALDGSGLEKVVAESTGAAQPGERIGDSNTLWDFEEGLRHQAIPAAINRAGYYMSNWDEQLDAVRKTGEMQTMVPADFAMPMVAPRDLGEIAANRLTSSLDDVDVRFVEGPRHYSAMDVAEAFAEALGRPVTTVVTPRNQWVAAYRKLGFSQPAAESYARMTGLALDQGVDSDDPIRGPTTLSAYIRELVDRQDT
jgi:uncharacterized protein YbjT (DUF2867 family)